MFHLRKVPAATVVGDVPAAGGDVLPDRLIGTSRGVDPASPLSPARSDSGDEKDGGRCSSSDEGDDEELKDVPAAAAAKAAKG